MRDNLDIEKLFKDKFEKFEPTVNEKVWQGIASNVSVAGTTAATGITWLKGLLIGAVATTIGVGAWIYFDKEEVPNQIVVGNDSAIEKEEVFNENNSLRETAEEVNIATLNVEDEKPDVIETAINQKDIVTTANVSDIVEKTSQNTKVAGGITVNDGDAISTSNANSVGGMGVDDKGVDQTTTTHTPSNLNSTSDQTDVNNFVTNQADDTTDDSPIGQNMDNDNTLDQVAAATTIENKSYISEIPNVFTPSNDNTNDEFFIPIENMQNIASFYIVIYSKQNVKLYESQDPEFRWDGYDFSDNKVPKGVYYYLVKAVGLDGVTYSKPGQISIY